jgi:adenosylcobinamide-phosphate synthase
MSIAAAYLLDWLAGDPEWLPHPVRLIGCCTAQGESLLRKPGRSPREELVAGAALTIGVVGLSYFGTAKAIAWAGRPAEILLGWTCLATRNLVDESLAVLRALRQGDVPGARLRLSRIVGRDTDALSETEIHRAVIETLAESACDGIVAPLFYLGLGGVPLAMAYKAVNTLDSMIGHADERYFYFGKAAARLDDLANYLPARLTALAIAAAAGTTGASALRTWRRDGAKHKSPNAGQPESAMAGALQVRLGGANTYAGELLSTPLLGAEFAPPQLHHVVKALRLVVTVSLLGFSAAVLVRRLVYSSVR